MVTGEFFQETYNWLKPIAFPTGIPIGMFQMVTDGSFQETIN
jgi:hypothetical protein